MHLARLHHFINRHVLLESQLAGLVAHERLILPVDQLGLMTSLRSSDPLQLLNRVWSHTLDLSVFIGLALLVLLLDPLMGQHSLFDALGIPSLHPIIPVES